MLHEILVDLYFVVVKADHQIAKFNSLPNVWLYAIYHTGENFYLCIAEMFGGINFHQCGKGHHIVYVIINPGQKICR